MALKIKKLHVKDKIVARNIACKHNKQHNIAIFDFICVNWVIAKCIKTVVIFLFEC